MNTYFILSVCVIAAVVYTIQILWYVRRVKELKSTLDSLFARHVALLAEHQIIKYARAAKRAGGKEDGINFGSDLSFKLKEDEVLIKTYGKSPLMEQIEKLHKKDGEKPTTPEFPEDRSEKNICYS